MLYYPETATENKTFRVQTDGFFGELFIPAEDKYPGKALICFSGSDGGIEFARMLAGVFQGRGLTALALAYVMEEFPLGQVLRKSLRLGEISMYDLYLPLVQQPDPAAVIKAENITGSVLLISSKMNTMWPSELAAERIMQRLKEHAFPYPYRHLSYDHGSHMFVPMEVSSAKFFRGERGKNKDAARKDRMDSLEKTLKFVSLW